MLHVPPQENISGVLYSHQSSRVNGITSGTVSYTINISDNAHATRTCAAPSAITATPSMPNKGTAEACCWNSTIQHGGIKEKNVHLVLDTGEVIMESCAVVGVILYLPAPIVLQKTAHPT